MKPVLMIHEFQEEFLKLPLEQYILTFDDGLYSQYWFWDQHLKHLQTEKIFFISSGIICPENTDQGNCFCSSFDAHLRAKSNIFSDYMKISQIKELMKNSWVTIGGHGNSHLNLNDLTTLLGKVNHIKKDTTEMLDWFKEELNFKPTHFAYPYNDDLDGMYSGLLKQCGFIHFFGRERIPIETLLRN